MQLEQVHPGHFVAVVGGAVGGSVATEELARRGIYVAVFEQHDRPYGKIEDGLPKWHVKLRLQEERNIDRHLDRPSVFFVPHTKLGRDISFYDLVTNWGFSAVLMANGAWRDRPLPIPGIERFVGKGLCYQNPLVTWFNHRHEPGYDGESFEVVDGALVVGGGLASLDVVKILMLDTVRAALRERGILVDLLTLEHETIQGVLERHGLTLDGLGLQGCTLFYRRRVQDMPLASLASGAGPAERARVEQTRAKLLGNFQRKYLFRFQGCRAPTGYVEEGGRLAGLVFAETEVVDGEVRLEPGTEHVVRSRMVVSAIGSMPEPIPGVRMRGDTYEILDPETGLFAGHDHVFGLGNAVTGKGNIKVSHDHGLRVAEHVADRVLAWREQDYRELLQAGAQESGFASQRILRYVHDKELLSEERVRHLIERIRARQRAVGYDGDYSRWMAAHALAVYDEEVARARALGLAAPAQRSGDRPREEAAHRP